MLSGKDQHLACIKAKGTFDTRNAVTDSRRRGGLLAYAIYSTGKVRSPFWYWQWGQFLERQAMVFAQMMQAIRAKHLLLAFLAAI